MREGATVKRLAGAALVLTAIAAVVGGGAARAATITVCPTCTIQSAVDAAQPGDTIVAPAGSYGENVTVNKALTLEGAQAGVDARTRSGSESVVQSISIGAADVVVDGFTFNGAGAQVNVSSTASILSGVVVRNDVFDGYGSVGLPTSNAGDIVIAQNLFENAKPSSEAMQIKASSLAGGCNGSTVENNTFDAATNNGGSDVNFSCTGSASSDVTVSGNTSTGVSGGSSLTAFSGVTGGISVTGNTATTDGSSVFFFGGVSGTATITGNTFTSTSANGVAIHGGDSGTADGLNTGTFTISGNTLSGASHAVTVATASDTPTVTVHGNSLTGGVANAGTNTIDASGNWWGASAQPSAITGVTTTPWCVVSSCSVSSNTAVLTSLSVSGASIGTFASGTTSYTANVANSVSSVSVSATPNTGATASVSGGSSLAVGNNTITVRVTSLDGTVSTTYSITVVRAAAPVSTAVAQQTVANAPASASAAPNTSGSVSVIVAPVVSASGTTTSAAPVSVAMSWSPQTFTAPVTVTVTPQPLQASSSPTPVAGGFAVGNTVVQVSVTDASTGQAVTQFSAPLVIHVSSLPAGQVPAYSHDGVMWTTIPRLPSPDLPAAQADGYFVNADGSIDIYTRHATLFGLLHDTQAPTAPAFKGRILSGKLRLSWSGARDNVKIDHYVVSRNGHGYKSTKKTNVVLALKPGVYVVRAVDGAGNASKASVRFVVSR